MWKKLEALESKFQELELLLADPAVLADQTRYHQLSKHYAQLQEIVKGFREYRSVQERLAEAREILGDGGDPELRELAAAEVTELEEQGADIEQRLKVLLLPQDPNDEKNVVLEIRAGTGGEEAALFAHEIFRMYQRYAEQQKWKVDVTSRSETGIGGLKEVIAIVEGKGAYSRLKYESGVHRVQRVPETEASGRIHTSAVTVAVMPEAEDIAIEISPDDLDVERLCSASGPGGQSINTTYSAVRLTHQPTGMVVYCKDERSQQKNLAKAMRVLKSRLYDLQLREQQAQIAAERRSMVGSGDRSEKIRTYNFPQNRVTDHRIGLTLHRLGEVLDGHLTEVVDALIAHHQAELLKQQATETGDADDSGAPGGGAAEAGRRRG